MHSNSFHIEHTSYKYIQVVIYVHFLQFNIRRKKKTIATMITILFEKILLIFKIRFTRTNQIPYCLYIPLWFLLVMIILFFFNNDLSLKKPKQLVF